VWRILITVWRAWRKDESLFWLSESNSECFDWYTAHLDKYAEGSDYILVNEEKMCLWVWIIETDRKCKDSIVDWTDD